MFFFLSKVTFFVIRPLNFMILLLALGVMLSLFGRRRVGVSVIVLSLCLLVAGAWTSLPDRLMRPLEARFPVPDLAGRTVDGILVLGGGADPDLSAKVGVPVLSDAPERYLEAVVLARRFPDAKVVFSGGSGALEGGASEAPVAETVLTELGLARDRILLEGKSRNTHENAVFSKALVHPQPGEHWILITSAFHMPRSVGIFREVGWPGLIPYPVGLRGDPEPSFPAPHSPTAELGLLDVAVKEYVGLVAYRVMGYTDALFPAP